MALAYLSHVEYRTLCDARLQIRRTMQATEAAALALHLEPQQHQLLIAIRALDEPSGPMVGRLAEYLMIKHHSAVGLIDRLALQGLVERRRGANDRRQVRVRLTPAGEERLALLAEAHRAELREGQPKLVLTLAGLCERMASPAHPAQAAERNDALIEKFHAALSRLSSGEVMPLLAEDIEWVLEGPPVVPYTGVWKGIRQVAAFFETVARYESGHQLQMASTVVNGDHAAALGRTSARVKTTGKIFHSRVMHFFTMRDDKIRRLVQMLDTAALAEAYR